MYDINDFIESVKEKDYWGARDAVEKELLSLEGIFRRLQRNNDNWKLFNYYDHLNDLSKILYGSIEPLKYKSESISLFADIVRPYIEQGLVRDVYRQSL